MLRATCITLGLIFLACARDEGTTKVTAPNDAAFATEVANAGEGGNLHTDDVQARAVFNHVHAKFRECDGEDGHYFEGRNVFTGTSTGDSRLSGDFELAAIQDLFNVTTLYGPQTANITIRDPATGRVKAEGVASSTGHDPWLIGTIVGVVRDQGGGSEETSGGGKWIANFRVNYADPAGIVVSIGGLGPDNQMPATIFGGGCPGAKYTEFDLDLGPSSASTLSATSTTGVWRHRFP